MKLSIKKFKPSALLFFVCGVSLLFLNSCEKDESIDDDQSTLPVKPVTKDVEVSDMNIAEGTATVRWTALTSKGAGTLKDGSAATVKGYDVEYSKGSGFSESTRRKVAVTGDNKTSAVLTGLQVGETYSFKIYAKNDNPNKKYSKSPDSDVKQFKFSEPSKAKAPKDPTELKANKPSATSGGGDAKPDATSGGGSAKPDATSGGGDAKPDATSGGGVTDTGSAKPGDTVGSSGDTNTEGAKPTGTNAGEGNTQSKVPENIPEENSNSEVESYDPQTPCGTEPHFVNISDVNFLNAIKALIPDAFEGDKMNVNHCDVRGLKSMYMSHKSISSVEGIQYFTGLSVFKCDDNDLTTLDLSANLQLKEIRCSKNKLTYINVPGNSNLKTFYAYSNKLTSLDLSHNTGISSMSLRENKLKQLDIRGIIILSSSRNFTLNAYKQSGNPLTQLNIHEDMKQQSEIVEAKENGQESIKIATYSDSGSRTCSDWDPLENTCLEQ